MQTLTRHQERIVLPSADTPTDYYNIQADLGERLPPPLDPQTRQPANPATPERILAKELIRQEISGESYVPMPAKDRDADIGIGRPTPLARPVRRDMLRALSREILCNADYLSTRAAL